MQAQIIPIQTSYKGYRFRSRLEARWAVFFDAKGIEYEYEPNAYQTSLGGYLPDFYLPNFNDGVFVEVKPRGGFLGDALQKCLELSIGTKTPCMLAEGSPDDVYYAILDPEYTRNWPVEPWNGALMGTFCPRYPARFWIDSTEDVGTNQKYWFYEKEPSPSVCAARGYRF